MAIDKNIWLFVFDDRSFDEKVKGQTLNRNKMAASLQMTVYVKQEIINCLVLT